MWRTLGAIPSLGLARVVDELRSVSSVYLALPRSEDPVNYKCIDFFFIKQIVFLIELRNLYTQ